MGRNLMDKLKELKINNLLRALTLKIKAQDKFTLTVVDHIIKQEMKSLKYDVLIDEAGNYKHEQNVFSKRSS